jgi:hypothetical protein
MDDHVVAHLHIREHGEIYFPGLVIAEYGQRGS